MPGLIRPASSCRRSRIGNEALAVLPGHMEIDLPRGSRVSIIPFADLEGLDLTGVKWPLLQRSVPLGSTLTLSNVALGPVTIALRSGYGIAIAYPAGISDD